MATGAASQLAGPAGIHALRLPLLWLTIALALAVAIAAAATRRQRRRAPTASFGDFTVPIGLAVIGGGVARLAGPIALPAAIGAVTLALVVTVALIVTVSASVSRSSGLASVGGTWFLAPAAVLADAIGIAALATRTPTSGVALGWAATATAGVGAAGYLVVFGLATARVAIYHLDGTARPPWWIAAGCGGLSAAALGRAEAVIRAGAGSLHTFGWAAMGCWILGTISLVPVLVGSGRYLLGMRKLTGSPPWPPTFSTGVYALGAIQVGHLLRLALITSLADAAAVATVCLWGLTVCAHLPRLATSST